MADQPLLPRGFSTMDGAGYGNYISPNHPGDGSRPANSIAPAYSPQTAGVSDNPNQQQNVGESRTGEFQNGFDAAREPSPPHRMLGSTTPGEWWDPVDGPPTRPDGTHMTPPSTGSSVYD